MKKPHEMTDAKLGRKISETRADITRTALVVQTFIAMVNKPNGQPVFPPYEDELNRNIHRLCTLLARERELMGEIGLQ